MKNYIRPSVEVSKFDVADIITASGDVVPAGQIPAEYTSIYEQYSAAAAAEGNTVQTGAAVFEW